MTTLGPDSEDVFLGNTEDSWLITYIQGFLNCDAGPCEFGILLNANPILAQQAQTSVTFAVAPFTFYTFIPLNPTFTFTITTGGIPAGGSFLELNILVAGYHTGLYV